MNKFFCIFLGCLIVNLLMFQSVFAESEILLASKPDAQKADITANQPQMHVEHEAQLPAVVADEEEQSWFSKYKWWLLAGLVVVGGAAAAGGGGGGGGGSSSDNPTASTTGNIQVDW